MFCLGISLSNVYVTVIFKEEAHEEKSTEIQEYYISNKVHVLVC